jgi:hypothetical protein
MVIYNNNNNDNINFIFFVVVSLGVSRWDLIDIAAQYEEIMFMAQTYENIFCKCII